MERVAQFVVCDWLCGDVHAWPAGWVDIVERLCIGIAEALAAGSVDGFNVTQLKEKYGGLKVYCDPHRRAEATSTDRRIAELVAAAEMESLATCEICGRPGTAQWLDGRQERESATLCEEHRIVAERS